MANRVVIPRLDTSLSAIAEIINGSIMGIFVSLGYKSCTRTLFQLERHGQQSHSNSRSSPS